ncbi:hypothetical protein [Tellurirhabdus bombi]|uniref:hypothetical protein n=1 Tax=Tellurirhabdus bombi TaxID=2907205 RepID=UPI001F1F3D97|nr:hypothetical protein [Tellurirhabdus bombi]
MEHNDKEFSLDQGQDAVLRYRAFAGMEAWLEIMAVELAKVSALQQGKDPDDYMTSIYENFNRVAGQNFKTYIEAAFPK